jgi:hypothetical protein
MASMVDLEHTNLKNIMVFSGTGAQGASVVKGIGLVLPT